MFLKEFLFSLDLFQSPINVYINGREKNTSHIGIFFSILIYTYVVVSLFQSDLFLKASPYIVSQSLETSHAEAIHFNNDTLLAFSVSDASHNNFIDPTIFTIEFKSTHLKHDSSGNPSVVTEYRKMRPCTLEDMPFGNSSLFISLALNNSFCLENKTIDIFGSIEEIEFKYFAVNIFLCDNSTSKVTCKTKEELNTFFTSPFKFFAAFYHNTQIDNYDYMNPFKISYKADYQMIDTLIHKRFYIYMKNSEIQTDDGIIFPTITNQKNIMFANMNSDFQTRIDPRTSVFQGLYFASKEKVEVTRKYEKLPETFGALTGMTYFFSFPCAFISKIVTYVITLRQVLNKLYFFPIIKKKNKNKKKKKGKNPLKIRLKNPLFKENNNQKSKDVHTLSDKEKIKHSSQYLSKDENIFLEKNSIPLKNSLPNSLFQPRNLVTSNKNPLEKKEFTSNFKQPITKNLKIIQDKPKLKEIINDNISKPLGEVLSQKNGFFNFLTHWIKKPEMLNNKMLELSYIEYFCYLITKFIHKKKTKKQKLIEKAENEFKSELEIVNILTRIHEIEKLKMIVLDSDQLVLFNYLTKPMIYLKEADLENSAQIKRNKMRLLSIPEKNNPSFNHCYQKIANSKDNLFNNRLIEFIDKNIE